MLINNKVTYYSRVTIIIISLNVFNYCTVHALNLYMSANTNHIEIVTAQSFSSCQYLTRKALSYSEYRFPLLYSYFNMAINII